MGDRAILALREDEEDIDFNDSKPFASQQYDFAVAAAKQNLSAADREKVNEPHNWMKVQEDIRKIIANPNSSSAIQRPLTQVIPFPRTLATFVNKFTGDMHPFEADVNIVWGLVDLNIKLSSVSPDRLTKTVGWMKRLRNIIDLFNRCLDVCEDMNEPRYSMVDILDSLLQILSESVRHLRKFSTDVEAAAGWRTLEGRINENLKLMDAATKRVNDINTHSILSLERQAKTLNLRFQQHNFPDEHVTFPVTMIPRNKNDNFYGREVELKNIDDFLGLRATNLRTYTIFGRRGVGKTDIALQYAYTNPSGFEAIFWVNCETAVALRQSFTSMAVALNIPGADRNGHHEENQLAVLKWLKTTKRRWLLIFDNAERESILKGYWPVSDQGSILITSRRYLNFTNEAQREGKTLKPFTPKESWNLLMKLLGPEYVEQDRKGLIKGTEERAAIDLLKDLGGLALAIEQAAELIKNDAIGGPNIASTYESFKDHQNKLPAAQIGIRSESIHSLESLWNMRFTHLSRNALGLLSVLSLLAPDGILIDLFLPRNQKALDGKLSFCKQLNPNHGDLNAEVTLSRVVNPPPLLRDALDELISFKLLKQENREMWAHRVVQEAMNYHSAADLQECFDSAVALVYEAFPKQVYGDWLSGGQWAPCENYIPHGAQLSFQFASINKQGDAPKLKGSTKFINLISNCAWFLYEVSDYDLCLRLVDTARDACEDKESLQYAKLCMVAGSAYYELNQLAECRKNWEIFMAIQEAKLAPGELELSNSYHNMGNLEAADSSGTDNLEKAAEYFERAIALRVKAGDRANNLLANSYLCMSRVYFLKKEYETASNMLNLSEAMFFRISGAEAHFMAHVHYAYGNIDFAQKRWASAKRAYEASLKISLANAPIHPITAAAYYSLGCVEYERGPKYLDNAKAYLDKAMAIAKLRSPDRIDGTIVRIMWKTSVILESDTFGTFQEDATSLRIMAETAMKTLTANGEGGLVLSLDEEGNADQTELEDAYDSLVPGYFR